MERTPRLRLSSKQEVSGAGSLIRDVRRFDPMSDQKPPREMFPESRLMLGMLSPVLGVFFAVCIYFTGVWEPSTTGDRIGKFAVEDILFTFITLCGVGLIASVVGPDRIRPLIMRVGGRAARAGLALMLGTIVYMLYCWLES